MNVRQIPQRARRLALATVVGAAAVGSVTVAPSAGAQTQDPQGSPSGERMDPRQIIDLRMARMTETLKLDSAQETKIRSMIADETMAMEELRKNGTEAAYFKNTPGIEDTRKWYADLGNKELKELEAKYRY